MTLWMLMHSISLNKMLFKFLHKKKMIEKEKFNKNDLINSPTKLIIHY